jgi:hypothetical protein
VDRHVRAAACALAAVYRPGRWTCATSTWPRKGELARTVLVAEALRGALVDAFALADRHPAELDELYPHLVTRLVDGHRGGLGGAGDDQEAGWKEGPR